MIDKDKIIVIKNSDEVVISYNGQRLVLPINDFVDMDKEQIKDWYITETNNS